MNQSDVAKLLGVSRATVSRALRGSNLVSPALRKRIQQVCDEVGYHPNYIASSLSTKETNTISVVMGAKLDGIYCEWLAHIRDAVRRAGYKFRWDAGEELDRVAAERSADGFIVFGTVAECADQNLSSVRQRIKRMVLTDCPSADDMGRPLSNSVSTGAFQGAALAVNHFLSLGHRRVGFFGLQPLAVSKERHAGYVRTMNDAGLPAPAGLTVVQERWSSDYVEYARYKEAVVSMVYEGVTAVLASTDVGAVAVIKLLAEEGLDVPGDVSVIGFDDTVLSRLWTPQITSVKQDIQTASTEAMAMLLRLLATGQPQEGVVVAPSLVLGKTVSPPSKHSV